MKDQDLTRSDLVSTRNIRLLSVITRLLHTSILVSTESNKDGTKKSDWDLFKTTCTASGMSSKVCAAKYKMESLYNKYEESKHAWQ